MPDDALNGVSSIPGLAGQLLGRPECSQVLV